LLSNTAIELPNEDEDDEYNIVFKPLPGAQSMMLSCPAQRQLFVGTRGSGKTEITLAHFRKYVGMGYGPFLKGVYLATSYKGLDDLITKSQRMYGAFNDGAKFLASAGSNYWKWPSGESLLFRVINNEAQYNSILHGHEVSHIYFNELSSWPDLSVYDLVHSSNRNSFEPEKHSPVDEETGEMTLLPELKNFSIATTNPYGPSARDIKERFGIGTVPYGKITTRKTEAYDPITQKIETYERTQCAIFSSWIENTYLKGYGSELMDVADPAKRIAWLTGEFSQNDDTLMFGDVFDKRFNVVNDFMPPQQWKIYRCFDYGSAKPFAVIWAAISDGSDVMIDGELVHTVKNDIFCFKEWYGWTGKKDTGVRMLATQIGRGIIERELEMGIYGHVKPGPSDSAIFNVDNGHSVGRDLAEKVRIDGTTYKGPTFLKSDKSPGTRKTGYERMRIAFANARKFEGVTREKPGLFICECCDEGILRTVPALQRDPDRDFDTLKSSEDHCSDVLRYLCNSMSQHFSESRVLGQY